MASSAELRRMFSFIQTHKPMGFFSTRAKVADVWADVYNVTGSTQDPKIGGKSWKQLLISHGINHDCYVTNQKPPSGTTHSHFSVGGHVIDTPSGNVPPGGITYLMPLCHWHNSTHRDGLNFSHNETRMLQLDGFMQGDTATTFMARLSNDSDKLSRIIFETEHAWEFQEMTSAQCRALKTNRNFHLHDDTSPVLYFVITKSTDSEIFYFDFGSEEFEDI